MQPKLLEARKGGAVPKTKSLIPGIQSYRAFTLIEAMIVMLIVAILMALAYPSYVEQVRKARRAEAETALLDSAALLERCFTRLNSYANCPDITGGTENGYYTVGATITATTYTLTAAPQGDQATDPCGTYTLDFLGNKTPVADFNRCWGSKSS